MLLVEVPATWTHLQRGDLVIELVGLAFLFQSQGAANRLAEIDLALNLVVPRRRIRIFEVGHVAVGARVERVDHHLGVDRTGDFDATAFQRFRQRRDLPGRIITNVFGFSEEIEFFTCIQALGQHDARRE